MSFRKLPALNALAAFEAVARHRSFTKAADELFLTHSAVSQRPWVGSGQSNPACSSLVLQAAVDGRGVALGRRMLVEDLLNQGLPVGLFDISACIEEAFYVVFMKESRQAAEVAAFVNWIKSVAEGEVSLLPASPSPLPPIPAAPRSARRVR